MRWTFAGRILPTFESDMEFQFTLMKTSKNGSQIIVVAPIKDSLRKQLRLMKENHKTASLSEILKLVRIQQCQLTTKDVPGLILLSDELEKIKVSSIQSGELYNDPTAYEFVSTMNPNVSDQKNMRKVTRGGSWKDVSYYLQVSTRDFEYADSARSYIGFRTIQDYMGTDVTGNASK